MDCVLWVSENPMSDCGTSELAALDRDIDRLRLSVAEDVSAARAALLATEPLLNRIVQLGEWASAFPRATSQLLRVIARDPVASARLASTVLGCRWFDPDDADEVLAAAFPGIRGAVRDAAADRVGVRRLAGIAEGVGYMPVPPPDPTWLWPIGRPFPSADTVEGVQARLNYFDLGAGPVTGTWSEPTRRAFVRWQVLNGLEPNGVLDEDSIDHLAHMAPSAPEG